MRKLLADIISTANAYVDNFSDLGNLDYSIESLKIVDEQLDDMMEYDFDEDAIFNVCSMVGSYVFETARRNCGGVYTWDAIENEPILVMGEPDFSVSIKAWDKVKKRLKNGEEDSILFYIKGYKEHIEIGESKKNYNVFII